MGERDLGRGRSLVGAAYPDDDGSADPALRAAIAHRGADLLDRLRAARVLVAVVAVLDEVDESGGDKASHMAVVSMVNAEGEKGLLAFTGLDALTAWDPAARPVPVSGAQAAKAAIEDGATALVLDVMGPRRVVIAGAELAAVADGD